MAPSRKHTCIFFFSYWRITHSADLHHFGYNWPVHSLWSKLNHLALAVTAKLESSFVGKIPSWGMSNLVTPPPPPGRIFFFFVFSMIKA
mmetsp:Transcript_77553/g.136787  ORF Transcript_77553/g.136787 Transcript_77553/m.136787 type:complete len:89 (-) Transcript_77553:28-294(-)